MVHWQGPRGATQGCQGAVHLLHQREDFWLAHASFVAELSRLQPDLAPDVATHSH
jgi:hypothetical protein